MPRTVLTAILALAIGAAAGAGAMWKWTSAQSADTARMQRRTALLTEENERLRLVVDRSEKTRNDTASKVQRQAVEQATIAIRGLELKEPVDYQVLTRKEIKGVLSGKMSEVFSEQEFHNVAASLAALGLLEPEYPLRAKYIDLLGEQIAAFYDQHAHKLFMYEDASLDNAQNRVVLAHELTHALQDQHFGLKKLPLESKTNDDRAVAASALVEGDATLVMSEYTMKNMTRQMVKDTLLATFGQDSKQLAAAPRYLREMLVFPYLRGQEFCTALAARGGYDAIDSAYARPPSSTAQILHPEKYTSDPREEPIDVVFADTAVNGQPAIADNVLGEFGTRLQVAEWTDDATGEKAGAGWRGDRYLCFDGGRALVWKSVWADEREAGEFFDAERQVLERRYRPTGVEADERRFQATAPRHLQLTRPRPNEVLLIDAATAEWAKTLSDQFSQ